jgi:TonB-dependent SusC/RagA subfamily outer membrane receptor
MQQIQLNIPEPCHEDWQNMTPTDQGRFCNACAKQVVDFSVMTDTQVLNYFINKKDEKVCGRAYPDQLERAITMPKAPKKRLFWHWNYITMLFLFFSKTNTAKAQGNVIKTIQTDSIKPNRFYNSNNLLSNGIANSTKSNRWVSAKIITGKVTDNNGDPIPFAAIKIMGSHTGVGADALGNFSLKANIQMDILEISGSGYFKQVFVLKELTNYNFILAKDPEIKEVFVGGLICYSGDGLPAPSETIPKHVAIIQVKDNVTGQPIGAAAITIREASSFNEKSVAADKNGIYKLKKIAEDETYLIKIVAPGYQANNFKIIGDNLKNRKLTTEVLLNKIETRPLVSVKPPSIVIGQISSSAVYKKVLYVVDDMLFPDGLPATFNSGNIEDIKVLKVNEATAIFGVQGAAGAIIITTKKPDYKKLDTVVVSGAAYTTRKLRTLGGAVLVTSCTIERTFTDTLKLITTKITGDLKLYPNPVQKGNYISIALKLKQAGVFNIQVINAAGLIVLQKQSTATVKQYIEQVQTGKEWSSGIYYVRIFDSNNKMISTSNFLVQ